MNDEIAEQPYVFRPSVKKPLMVRLVLATGLVSTERAANYLLFCLAVAGISIALIVSSSSGKHASPPPADQIIWVAN